jgi:hypothetical protein
LNDLICDANRSIALEFFANALVVLRRARNYTSIVRGITILYNPSAINRLLGLRPLAECAIRKRTASIPTKPQDLDVILQ